MAYAHIEMFLYRPFLHYASPDTSSQNIDKRSYACAAACVSVSRNIVHLTEEMKKRGLLMGSYWFYMYTTFFAILALLFYVLENPTGSTSMEILKDAYEGKDTLSRLSANSLAADRCTKYLTVSILFACCCCQALLFQDLFSQLSEKLHQVSKHPAPQKREHVSQNNFSAPEANSLTSKPKPPSRAKISPSSTRGGMRPSKPRPIVSSRVDQTLFNDQSAAYTPSNASVPPSPNTWITATTDQGVNDLGAMMFPSGDPFAYPTQPMITLENRQFKPSDNAPPQFFPPTSTGIGPQGMEPMIPDMALTPPGQTSNTYYGTQNTGLPPPNVMSTQQGGGPWQQPHPALHGLQDGGYDNLFGEDWSGWMPHSGSN